MKPSIKSTLGPHKDLNINNTEKESQFRPFDFIPTLVWFRSLETSQLLSKTLLQVSDMMDRESLISNTDGVILKLSDGKLLN